MKTSHSTITMIGSVVKWCLVTLKNTIFGIGGIALFIIAGLYIAGALIEPVRWYLVGIASALLLTCGVLLALFYARSILNRIINDQRTQVSDIKKQLQDMKRALGVSEATLAKMNVVNFPLFRKFNRRVTNEDLRRFAEEWVPRLGLNLNLTALGYMAHRICLAEDTCVGRLAGDIEDMLLRILVARSIKEPELSILEIGTLFGVSMAIVYENCRRFFAGVRITVIDPLNGYYDKSLDTVTMMPVTRDMFAYNMRQMSIPESDYTIIQKLSTEDEAKEQASKRRYNVLVIDGDHSYSGVKHDFFNYGHLVKRDGYIVFDNYNDPDWPGVTDFVNKEVAKMPDLEFVGADGITAVFRVAHAHNQIR